MDGYKRNLRPKRTLLSWASKNYEHFERWLPLKSLFRKEKVSLPLSAPGFLFSQKVSMYKLLRKRGLAPVDVQLDASLHAGQDTDNKTAFLPRRGAVVGLSLKLISVPEAETLLDALLFSFPVVRYAAYLTAAVRSPPSVIRDHVHVLH